MRNHIIVLTILCLLGITGLMAQGIVPPAPTNLKAEATSDLLPAVKLTWKVPAGLWGFVIYRSVDDSIHFEKLAMANSPVYDDHQVRPGSTYYYYVTSVMMGMANRPLESAPSNIAWIVLSNPPERVIGVIAGTVKDDTTGKPIPGVRIIFYGMRPSPTFAVPFAVSDSLGRYEAKLPVGMYTLLAEPAPWMPPGPPAYAPEWFDNKKDQASADPVTVVKDSTVIADFGLSRPTPPPVLKGIITGRVFDDVTKQPIPGIFIRFFKRGPVDLNWQPTAMTDVNGVYAAKLDTGSYLINAESISMSASIIGYISEWFDNVTEVSQATPVHVTNGSTSHADFGLGMVHPPVYVSIQGTVTDTLGAPLRRATVVIMRTLQELTAVSALTRMTPGLGEESMDVEGVGFCRGIVWKGYTDSMGAYTARVLSGRPYIALASKWGYLPEYFDNKHNPLMADVIKASGDVKDINFSLAPNPLLTNSISGVVRDSAGNGVPSIVVLFPVRPSLLPVQPRFGHTDSTGAFTLGDVVLGTYVVLAVPFSGYAPAFYKAGAFGVMHWNQADKVLVNGDVSGITIGVVPILPGGFARLRGRILSGLRPLPGVRVLASSAGGEVVGCGLSDADGLYTVEALPSGKTTISVDRPNYAAAEQVVTIASTQPEVDNIDFSIDPQVATGVTEPPQLPASYALHQNYPNPFNPSTTITFDMPASGWARLKVFNMLGQEVRTLVDGPVAAGTSRITWNAADGTGRSVASGLYFYRLTVMGNNGKGLFTGVQKMLLVR